MSGDQDMQVNDAIAFVAIASFVVVMLLWASILT